MPGGPGGLVQLITGLYSLREALATCHIVKTNQAYNQESGIRNHIGTHSAPPFGHGTPLSAPASTPTHARAQTVLQCPLRPGPKSASNVTTTRGHF